MSADIDNQPYDNVEFPIKRPGGPAGPSPWVAPPMTATQRTNLVTGGTAARGYPGNTLATVAESGGPEEESEEGEVKFEDPRRTVGVGPLTPTPLLMTVRFLDILV